MCFLKTLTTISLVSFTVAVHADERDAIAQDLTELRQQISEPGSQLQAEATDFQQAVRDVARDERRNAPSSRNDRRTFNTPDFGTPTARRTTSSPPGYGPQPQNFFPDAVNWGQPPHHRRPAPTPASRLRETAFELDRLAHGLEMAELYEGADTLRDTAEKLRQSARATVPRQDGEAIQRPAVPGGKSLPK